MADQEPLIKIGLGPIDPDTPGSFLKSVPPNSPIPGPPSPIPAFKRKSHKVRGNYITSDALLFWLKGGHAILQQSSMVILFKMNSLTTNKRNSKDFLLSFI